MQQDFQFIIKIQSRSTAVHSFVLVQLRIRSAVSFASQGNAGEFFITLEGSPHENNLGTSVKHAASAHETR